MLWQGEGGINPVLDPRYYFPYSAESAFAEAWQAWYNGANSVDAGGVAEEPPAATRAIMRKYDALKGIAGFDNQVKAMNEILKLSAEQFYCIGIMTPPDQYGIVKNNMHNVPKRMVNSWVFPTPAPLNTFAFFFN
jgi:peptide/nickel transport system substrate-binding protein